MDEFDARHKGNFLLSRAKALARVYEFLLSLPTKEVQNIELPVPYSGTADTLEQLVKPGEQNKKGDQRWG